VIDLEVPEFADLPNAQRKKAIARRTLADEKKKKKESEMKANKEKKGAEHLAKLVEKEKEKVGKQ
jgi:hypothetical protein